MEAFKKNVLKLAKQRVVAHGGDGEIDFVRPFAGDDFETHLSFIDYAVIPPGHSIGRHRHGDNEEVYFVVSGTGHMTTNGMEHRVEPGDLIVNRRNWEHGLYNDSEEALTILVWEVAYQDPFTGSGSLPMSSAPHNAPTVVITSPVLTAISGIAAGAAVLLGSALGQHYRLVHFLAGSQGRPGGLLRGLYRMAVSPLQLALVLRRSRAAILHINTALYPKSFWRDLAYALVANLLRVPVILHVHGGHSPRAFARDRALAMAGLRWALRRTSRIVVVSWEDHAAYRAFLGSAKVVRIPNAVDLQRFGGGAPKAIGDDLVTAVFIGRLIEAKGLFEILEVAHRWQVRGTVPRLRLRIAGSGPAELALRARVAELGLEAQVTFSGEVHGADKEAFWREAQVLLFPSYHEKMPNAILESIASATPVITCPVNGIPDVVEDGVHGFFVPPRDAAGLVKRLHDLLSDPALYHRMSHACQESAREFDVASLVRRCDALYAGVLGQEPRFGVEGAEGSGAG